MPSTSKNNRKGKVTWTRELKTCVHLLHTEFDLRTKERVDAFNVVFERYLRGCGLSEGVTRNTFTAQYNERKKPKSRDWSSICQPAANAWDSETRDALRERIREALSKLTPQPAYQPRTSVRQNRQGSPGAIHATQTATPSASTRSSRSRAAVASAAYELPATPVRNARSSPAVVSPKVDSGLRTMHLPTPQTPRSTKSSAPRVAFNRNDGSTILVSPKASKSIQTRAQSVSEKEAHPPLPGLLFRYWNEDSDSDMNSRTGFTARKYHRCNVVPHVPPPARIIDPVDVFNHMDRKIEKTPFISTSSRLVWILQLLIKGLKGGNEAGRLSVIDASALDKRTVFHARPFHNAIVKMHPFSNGAWHYAGTYEYMVWRKIPRQAIIHTFDAQELLDLASDNEAIRAALRFDVLRVPHQSLSKTKLPILQDGSVRLTADIVIGLSDLCLFFGLNAYSPPQHLSHIVSDVIEGWSLQVDHRDEAQWYQLAAVFSRSICNHTTPPVTTIKDMETTKLAFLNGVHWGCGKVNASHSTALIVKKNRKAAAAGLGDPAKIITNQLDAAKLAVLAFQKSETRRLERYHEKTPALLAAAEDVEENDLYDDDDGGIEIDDMDPVTPTRTVGDHDEIQYDEDDELTS